MTFWSVRESLSMANRLRRSYYELLRDDLDQFLLKYALIDSYNNFLNKNAAYPFVEKRELKPRTRINDIEYESQNTFLIIFIEDSIPANHKKYIRFYDINKTTKDNIIKSKTLPLDCAFDRSQKFFDSARFFDFMQILLPVDYALLIQRDPASKTNDRYVLSHFHVRIDWPVVEAAENLAVNLRYISKDIYEKGDKYAEDIQKKFFEYYGLPVMAGGRRTAAIVAAQYFKRNPCITTIYVGSSGSRSLTRISERGVSKAILMKFTEDEINQIAASNYISYNSFKKHYVVAKDKKDNICIFQAIYTFTDHARPPDDGKLRELRPDLYWQAVEGQFILPKPRVWKYPPLPYNTIYS
ncbi:hypothetical protein [Desulfobacterium sp. N47]|uniref:Uncharacterized protein n=1 Tax=uncultured Desulfobacterium sp. TaxID=201089 RepID=E1YHX8_9BACT|nr:hypothetical protein N47_D30560 [uncultured Desulfobacterium sp.]